MSDNPTAASKDAGTEGGGGEPGPAVLACGRDPLDVIDRARAGRSTEHDRDCPYCQAVIAADRPAARGVSQLATADAAVPVPDTLLPGVMRSVWSELRRDTMIPLPTDAGTAFVADHTVAAVIEDVLDRASELQVHTCTIALDATGSAASSSPDDGELSGSRIGIAITAAAAYNSDVRGLAARARALVRAAVARQFGWQVDTIDIDIVDVYLPEEAPA